MTNLEIYKVMREIVLAVTPVTQVIRSNPNAPAPDGEYCAISVSQTRRQRGQANIKFSSVDQQEGAIKWEGVNYDIRAQELLDVTMNFYRGEAHEYAHCLFQANKRPDVNALLFANQLGWRNQGPVNNLNFLQSENWENRAQIVITLGLEKAQNVDVNGIYKVEVEVCDENDNVLDDSVISTPVRVEYQGYGNAQYGRDQYEEDEITP